MNKGNGLPMVYGDWILERVATELEIEDDSIEKIYIHIGYDTVTSGNCMNRAYEKDSDITLYFIGHNQFEENIKPMDDIIKELNKRGITGFEAERYIDHHYLINKDGTFCKCTR